MIHADSVRQKMKQQNTFYEGCDAFANMRLRFHGRSELRLMVGIITVHIALNYNLIKFVPRVSSMCG